MIIWPTYCLHWRFGVDKDQTAIANGHPNGLSVPEMTFDQRSTSVATTVPLTLEDDHYHIPSDLGPLVIELDDCHEGQNGPQVVRRTVGHGRHGEVESSGHGCHPPLHLERNLVARNKLIIVSVLCMMFMTAEIVGGILSNSLALITDATHLVSDFTSFLISIFAMYVAKKPPTSKMTFGYYRAEVIGAIISILIIWLVTAVLFYMAVHRVIHEDYHIGADEMLITAGLGVAFNIIMGVVLHSGFCKGLPHGHSHGGLGHGHSHGGQESNGHTRNGHAHNGHVRGHDHSYQNSQLQSINGHNSSVNSIYDDKKKNTRSNEHINVRAAFIHVLGDLVQSVGVLIAAYIIKFKPEYKLADPICTFVFSVLVLFTTFTVMRDTVLIILEACPRNVPYKVISQDLQNIEGVVSVHNLTIWTLTVGQVAAMVHLSIGTSAEWKDVLKSATHILRSKHGLQHITVQVEEYKEVMGDCKRCAGPAK